MEKDLLKPLLLRRLKNTPVAAKFDNRGYFLDLILQIVAFILIPNKTIKSFY